MTTKATFFTWAVVVGTAVVGIVALSTCANDKKTPEPSAPTADKPTAPAPKTTTNATIVKEPTKPEPEPVTATRPPKMDHRLVPIIADLVAKFEKHEGITATVQTEMSQAAEGEGSTGGNGIYDCKKQDGKWLIHFWITNTLTLHTDDKNYMTGEILHDLYDGEFLYRRLQQPKLRNFVKQHYSPNAILQIGGRALFQALAEKYDLKLLTEAEGGESPTHVIEASPLTGAWTTKHYFDKETGIRMRIQEFNEQDEKVLTLELSEIKLNPEFGPTAFTPMMPRDFTFIDETAKPEPQP